MRKVLIALLCLLLPCVVAAKKDDPLKYDITSMGVSESGMTLVKISLYVKAPSSATTDLLKKAAVHGIIFRGVSDSQVTGYVKQKPLASSPAAAQEHADFFDTFFQKNGSYLSYANMVDETTKTVKVDKEYKVTAVVNVSTGMLRQALQDAGVIRKMTDGF